jgi:hypothetical protein
VIDLRSQKDLVVLVADRDMELAVRGVISHPEKLSIRSPCADVFTHLQRDPGCRKSGHEFLRPYTKLYRYALVIFDKHGCGRDFDPREAIETDLEQRLMNSGWADRAAAICIDPELEIWVWSDSWRHVADVLGWQGRQPSLETWLLAERFVPASGMKPENPKECMRKALRLAGKPASPVLFAQLAERISYGRCVDPSFRKLVSTLERWFPVSSA